ncbi:MAG TPA: hypothetical protein VK771_07525 [Acidimicrobiia bacterium]|nr:hypothetical protein [Acidimicrobiia bacterium]
MRAIGFSLDERHTRVRGLLSGQACAKGLLGPSPRRNRMVERALEVSPTTELGLENPSPMLQQTDLAKARILVTLILLSRNDLSVLATHLAKRL